MLLATNQPAALSNLVHEKTGARIEVTDPNDPAEREYQQLLELDHAAQKDVERWQQDESRLQGAGAGGGTAGLRIRARERYDTVEKAYQEFLTRHPDHVKGRIALGSFLGEIGREDEAAAQYVKAREIDPKNPAPWNNLANYYGHNGPVTNAFTCYEKAIELNPKEPVYYQNFATTVYLFRHDATNHYRISEQQVFDKALLLYRQAVSLSSNDFLVAADMAQTYYGIRPPRTNEAIQAWTDTFKLARDDEERQGVRVHLARWYRTAGDYEAVRRELALVTSDVFASVKERILKTLENGKTNAPAIDIPAK